MKITDPDVIKNGEKDLIKAVMDDLDLDAIQEILIQKMAAQTLSAKGGEIVVHNNEIAYRLDFEIQLNSSLMFDRQGNYISESDEAGDDELEGELEGELEDDSDETDESDDDESLISEDFDLDAINLDEPLEDDIEEEKDDPIEDDPIEDEMIDDDISDILEESREFWDQKKE